MNTNLKKTERDFKIEIETDLNNLSQTILFFMEKYETELKSKNSALDCFDKLFNYYETMDAVIDDLEDWIWDNNKETN